MSGAPIVGRRILLVEDHADSALALAIFLRRSGYEVTVAASVAAARAEDGGTYDVVVSDVRLPDGNGLDLMRELRSRRPVRGIAISGGSSDEDRRRSREAGFESHLVKPVDPRDVLRAIERVP